jgi:hypothetical protein
MNAMTPRQILKAIDDALAESAATAESQNAVRPVWQMRQVGSRTPGYIQNGRVSIADAQEGVLPEAEKKIGRFTYDLIANFLAAAFGFLFGIIAANTSLALSARHIVDAVVKSLP